MREVRDRNLDALGGDGHNHNGNPQHRKILGEIITRYLRNYKALNGDPPGKPQFWAYGEQNELPNWVKSAYFHTSP